MPRAGLLDPQGQAVEHALSALGFAEAADVRVGRAIELDVAAPTRAEAEARARQMCDKLLANPVTEDYVLAGGGRLMLDVAVVRFPGSNCDFDALRAAERVGADAYFVWHRDTDLQGADVVHPARRLQLRRLPPLRRHRALQPGHAGGAAPRRRRRAGARHLQRLPDPLRGAPAARAR